MKVNIFIFCMLYKKKHCALFNTMETTILIGSVNSDPNDSNPMEFTHDNFLALRRQIRINNEYFIRRWEEDQRTINALRSEKASISTRLNRRMTKMRELQETVNELKEEKDDLDRQFDSLETEHAQLCIDFDTERSEGTKMRQTLNKTRTKVRNLNFELNEVDRVSTKRNNRLVQCIETQAQNIDELKTINAEYEEELERCDRLCFVCRLGVKTVECAECNNAFCTGCAENMKECPFCRTKMDEEI